MMKYSLGLLLLAVLGLWGCSDSNQNASLSGHPADWFTAHRATTNINACGVCHGADLKGSGAAPSCFSASYDGRGCHAEGPGQAPHALDGSYRNPANHGPDAKADLTSCQACHSDNPTGGPGSNPRFNVGIESQGGTGCEACHGANLAHPAVWAGPENDVFHYTAANIQQACTLCHGTELDGVGGNGISCRECHAETTNLTLDCTACHAYLPDGAADMATATGVAHRTVAAISSHGECSVCHGVEQSTNGGELSTRGAYTSADHWNGSINMNSDTQYNQTNFGCDAAGCHGNDTGHQLSDSGLPVALGAFGTAGGSSGAPHAVGPDWLLRSGHVAAAAPSCLGCHVADGSGSGPSCLSCHTAGDPLAAGAQCESCHASPPNLASTAIADRPNRAGAHAVHTPLTADTTDCSACHAGAGTDTVNHYDPAEPASMQFPAAYNASAAASFSGNSCSNVSCHGGVTTPAWTNGSIDVYGGGTAACRQCHKASGETNSYASGEHSRHLGVSFITCLSCHDATVLQNGIAGNSHFSGLMTAVFELDPQQTINTSIGYDGTTCNTAGCHGSETW